jgi:hypothetical protein
VLDARTRKTLGGAKVRFLGGSSKLSLESGISTFDSVGTGTNIVEVSLDKYAAVQDTVQIPSAEKGRIPEESALRTILLHKQGVSLKGKILLRPKDSKAELRPGKDVIVELRLPSRFVNGYQAAKTDGNGEYVFEDLPEYAEYALKALSYETGTERYGSQVLAPVSQDLEAGISHTLPIGMLSFLSGSSLYMLTPMEGEWAVGKDFKVLFSAGIDTGSLDAGSIRLLQNGVAIALDYSWEKGNTQLSLIPYQGKWPAGGTLTVSLQGFRDVDGNRLDASGSLGSAQIVLKPSFSGKELGAVDSIWIKSQIVFNIFQTPVDTNAIDWNTTSYQLVWNAVDGADGYDVYSRETPASLWLLTGSSDDTTFSMNVQAPTTYKPITRSHLVVARSGTFRADISQARILELEDEIGPVLSGTGYLRKEDASQSVDNSYSSEPKKIAIIMDLKGAGYPYGIMEPLDTHVEPKLYFDRINTFYSYPTEPWPVFTEFQWLSGTSARIVFIIAANSNAMGLRLRVDLKEMRDKNGNPLTSIYGTPSTTLDLY